MSSDMGSARKLAPPSERLRELKGLLGLSQGHLAERIGCDQSFLSCLLAGKKKPGVVVSAAIESLSAAAKLPGGSIKPLDWYEDERQSA